MPIDPTATAIDIFNRGEFALFATNQPEEGEAA